MRWLLIHPGPQFSVADVHNGWAEALRDLGEEVDIYGLDSRLQFFDSALMPYGERDEEGRGPVRKAMTTQQAVGLAADGLFSSAFKWWPQVVLCVSAFFVPPFVLEVMRARGMKIVMLYTESPYQDDMQLKMAQYADLSLVNDPVNLGQYRATGPAEYMPHSYRPGVHYPAPPVGGGMDTVPSFGEIEKIYDFAFVGTGFPSRLQFFSQMDLAGLDVKFAGPWMDLPEDSPLRDWTQTRHLDGCVDNTGTAGIYRQSRTGINFYRREAEDAHAGEGWACGPREIEMAACGLWFTRDPRGESDDLFPMLPSFTTPQEASDHIRWALAHPEERAEAALKARAVIADRTFRNAARRLLALLDRQPVSM
jgi:spore maturation protein CgeB